MGLRARFKDYRDYRMLRDITVSRNGLRLKRCISQVLGG